MPKKNGRKRRNRIIVLILIFCILTTAIVLIVRLIDYHLARQEYQQYQLEIAPFQTIPLISSQTPVPQEAIQTNMEIRPSATPIPTEQPMFSKTMQKYVDQNSDTVAYINVIGTNIQYPVVQGKDNSYYTNHSFSGKSRAAGAIFLDSWNLRDLSDFNNVIYGHNMKDGSMFHTLREYRNSSFLQNHRYVEIITLKNRQRYRIFAAYIVSDGFDFRGFEYQTRQDKTGFLNQIMQRTEIKSGMVASADDKMITLVTCTSGNQDWHWVVHAVLQDVVTTD